MAPICLNHVGVEDIPDIRNGKLNSLTEFGVTRTGECKT